MLNNSIIECISKMLDRNDVPDNLEDIRKYLLNDNKRLALFKCEDPLGEETVYNNPDIEYMIVYPTRFGDHAVTYKNGEIVYNPNEQQKFPVGTSYIVGVICSV